MPSETTPPATLTSPRPVAEKPAGLPLPASAPAIPSPVSVAAADPVSPVQHAAILRARRRRVALVLGGLVAIFAVWEVVTRYVAYTADAFVRSDLVAVSAEVSGHVASVLVRDDQPVKRGDLLVTIDKTPFQLVVDQRQAQIRQANAEADAAQAGVAVAQDRLNAANASLAFAQATQKRAASLTTDQFMSQQDLDQANERLRSAQADADSATAAQAQSRQRLAAAQATISAAQAALASAEWDLGRTDVRAPVNGTVNNFHVRVGDTARADDPLIGIIDADAWRIVANYKQDYLSYFPIGTQGWVWLDAHPWHLYRAHVEAITRGISRDPGEPMLLPYVAPTTDWIRLQRRFPVLLVLDDPPPGLTLYMGADARVLIFP